jgi:GTP cyclohydrolase III
LRRCDRIVGSIGQKQGCIRGTIQSGIGCASVPADNGAAAGADPADNGSPSDDNHAPRTSVPAAVVAASAAAACDIHGTVFR